MHSRAGALYVKLTRAKLVRRNRGAPPGQRRQPQIDRCSGRAHIAVTLLPALHSPASAVLGLLEFIKRRRPALSYAVSAPVGGLGVRAHLRSAVARERRGREGVPRGAAERVPPCYHYRRGRV